MGAMTSQITSVSVVCSTVCWGADHRKHQSSASLAFTREYRWPIDSPHKGPSDAENIPFDDVIIFFDISQKRFIQIVCVYAVCGKKLPEMHVVSY